LISKRDRTKADVQIKRVIADSKSLVQRHPETLNYIGTAVRGYWLLAALAGEHMETEKALAYAEQANSCFEEYLGEHFDQVWVQSLYMEKQVGNVETHYLNGRYSEALKLSEKCLEVNRGRIENSAFRLAALTINYRMHATRYRIFLALNQPEEMQRELDELQLAAKMALEFDQCRAECLQVGESFQLPESVLSILRMLKAGGNGTPEKHTATE
jgi:tetratricopeptide (TPR) repeat protein